MYVDLGFQAYSFSDGAAKAFQLLFTVLNKKMGGGRINHIPGQEKLNMYKHKTSRRSTKSHFDSKPNIKCFLVPLCC